MMRRAALCLALALALACSGMTPAGGFYAAVDMTLPALAAADAWLYTAEARQHPAQYAAVKAAVSIAWDVVRETDAAITAGTVTQDQIERAKGLLAAMIERAAAARAQAREE